MTTVGEKIRDQRYAERAASRRSQSSPRPDAGPYLTKIYLATLALEQMQRDGSLAELDLVDIELRRDRLSRIYDRARGVV